MTLLNEITTKNFIFFVFVVIFFWRFSRFSLHRLILLLIRCFIFEFFIISSILIMISNFDFYFFKRDFWLIYQQSLYHCFFSQMQINFFCCWFRKKNERLFTFSFSSTTNVKLNIVFFSNFFYTHVMTKNVNNDDKLNFMIYYDFYLKFVNFDENEYRFFNDIKKVSINTFVIDDFDDFCLFDKCKHFVKDYFYCCW